jgi:hypothetical protein
MHTISQAQLFVLALQLSDALYGNNQWGGDTAEIYAYTLQRANPAATYGKDTSFGREALRKISLEAGRALRQVLELFCKEKECRAEVDGVPLKKLGKNWMLVHRSHVRIIKKKERRG